MALAALDVVVFPVPAFTALGAEVFSPLTVFRPVIFMTRSYKTTLAAAQKNCSLDTNVTQSAPISMFPDRHRPASLSLLRAHQPSPRPTRSPDRAAATRSPS